MRVSSAVLLCLALDGAGIPARSVSELGAESSEVFAVYGRALREPQLVPLSGVLIEVESAPRRRAVTDSAGTFRIDSLHSGTYVVTARAPGYLPERRRVQMFCHPPVIAAGREPAAARCTEREQSLSFLMRLASTH